MERCSSANSVDAHGWGPQSVDTLGRPPHIGRRDDHVLQDMVAFRPCRRPAFPRTSWHVTMARQLLGATISERVPHSPHQAHFWSFNPAASTCLRPRNAIPRSMDASHLKVRFAAPDLIAERSDGAGVQEGGEPRVYDPHGVHWRPKKKISERTPSPIGRRMWGPIAVVKLKSFLFPKQNFLFPKLLTFEN